MQGRFEVRAGDLAAAAGSMWGAARALAQVAAQLRGVNGSASAVPGPAGAALAGLMAAWQGATDRLTDGVDSFGTDTQAAAVLYEQTEASNTVSVSATPETARSALWHALNPQPAQV